MTYRQRQTTRRRRLSFLHDEDRQQFVVTAAFALLIALLVVMLVAAVALAYYNENIRAVARVGEVEIAPGMVRDRAALLRERLNIEEGRVIQAQINGEIDDAALAERKADIAQRQSELGITAIEGLIDLVYQAQLAAERAIVVSDEDVDARAAQEASGPERREVLAIFVEPQAADEDGAPSLRERREARERAESALEELEAGAEWADVAREYSTHESAEQGGELGVISRDGSIDEAFTEALFRLPESGTTPVVAGSDGTYRIGRAVAILPGDEEPGTRSRLLSDISEERYREFLRYELTAERLREQVEAEAIGATVEQVRLANILISDTEETDDPDASEGEIRYSEIVYAPNNDVELAPEQPADDPAWGAAQAEAEATVVELAAIEDADQMAERFAEIAREDSDSPVSADRGGDRGFESRGLMPEPIGAALFDEQHEEGELIGPVRSDAGYVVLLFHERRAAPQERLQAVQDALAQPDADFEEVARQYSDADDAEDGGELGWFTREMLPDEVAEPVFELQTGDVSEPIEFGTSTYFFKALERATRPLDADQVQQVRATAFENWYAPLKDEAEAQGVIVRAEGFEPEASPGLDVPGLDVGDEQEQ